MRNVPAGTSTVAGGGAEEGGAEDDDEGDGDDEDDEDDEGDDDDDDEGDDDEGDDDAGVWDEAGGVLRSGEEQARSSTAATSGLERGRDMGQRRVRHRGGRRFPSSRVCRRYAVRAMGKGRSTIDSSVSPPKIHIPRAYNAAVDLADRHVQEGRAGKVAFVDARGRVTYGELASRTDRAAAAIRALGVVPEERVLMVMLDTVDFPTVFLGAIKAGVVPVPVNTLLTVDDYAHMLVDSRARAVFVSDALLPKILEAKARAPHLRAVVVASSPLGGPAHGELSLDALLERSDGRYEDPHTTSDDVAFWLYSSGSTGAPKGAMHLHSSLVVTAALYAQAVLGIREDDVVYSAAKLFFAYGLGNALTFPLSVGATAILTAERPTPERVLDILAKKRPTIFGGVPTLFASLLARASDRGAHVESALRVSTSAGEALPKHLGERWRALVGSDILDGIGSTEMLHIFLSNRPGDVRYGTTGKPVPGYTLKLVGDDGEPVAAGDEGSLWVEGPSSAVAYHRERARSLATFHGPWTRTGDRYVRDEDGYYTYSGRADDMLKVGGIWVSPFEVESALSSHDAVVEAAVVGHTDDDGLVKPKAFVVLRHEPDDALSLVRELQAFVKSRLAPYKYPRWIEIVENLPKTATGKIQRFKLRAR
jgi:benzoate-CoA ligase family protein